MNKSYRNVFCKKTGTYVAAPETASARGKKSSGAVVAVAAVVAVIGAMLPLGSADAQTALTVPVVANNGKTATTAPKATGYGAVAAGDASNANGEGAVAIGASAQATNSNSVALGQGSQTDRDNSVSVGNGTTKRQITNVAAGTAATDAVNVSQLTAAGVLDVNGNPEDVVTYDAGSNKGTLTLGTASGTTVKNVNAGDLSANSKDAVNGSQLYTTNQNVAANATNITNVQKTVNGINRYFKADGLGGGDDATVQFGSSGVAMGSQASATGLMATAIGADAEANGSQTAAIGGDSHATSPNATAVGVGSKASGGSSTALGAGSKASVNDTTAIGVRANASNDSAVAIGNDASAAGSQGLAMGTGAHADVAASVALGYKAVSSNVNSVALGANSTTDRDNVVSVGSKGQERQITNVKAGTATTDAVNVSQLKGVTDALGGGAGLDANGKVIAPTYNLSAGKDGSTTPVVANDVGTALDNLDNRVAGNSTDINNLTTKINNIGPGLVQQDGADATITVAKDTGGTSVTFANNKGTARTLNGVAKGAVDKDSTDAINGSQLFDASTSVASALGGGAGVDANGKVTKPTYTMSAGKDGSTTPVVASDVGSALDNLDTRTAGNTTQINQNTGDIANVISGKAGLFQQAGADAAITVGKDTGGKSVTFANNAGTARTLNGVAAGVAETDAVNVGQLVKSGVIDKDGNPVDLVSYDKDSNKGSITLGGAAGTGTTLTNVAKGAVDKDSTDAINGSQLFDASTSVASALGGGAGVDANGKVTKPTYTMSAGKDGSTTPVVASDVGSALDNLDTRTAGNTTQINQNTGDIANVISGKAGLVQQAGADAAITVGKDTGGKSVTFANNAGTARTLNGVAAGVAETDAVNVGQLVKSGVIDKDGNPVDLVSYDKDSNKGSITLGGAAGTGTTLTNVAKGAVDKDSTDAINGSQLFDASTSVASALGGGAGVDANGKVTKPTYTMSAGKDGSTTPVVASDVGSALDNLDTRTAGNTTQINQNTGDIANVISGKAGLVQQAGADAAITVGKDTGGKSVTFANNAGTARTLNGVAKGAVNSNSTDAINGSQLFDASTSVASALGGGAGVDASGKVIAPSYTLGSVDGNSDVTVKNVGDALGNLDSRVINNSRYFKADGLNDGSDDAVASARGVAIGAGAVATQRFSVALGYNSVADAPNTVSVGSGNNTRRITHVGDAFDATDAVNLQTLRSTQVNTQSALTSNINDAVTQMDAQLATERNARSLLVQQVDAMSQQVSAATQQSTQVQQVAEAATTSSLFTADGLGGGDDATVQVGSSGVAAGSKASATGLMATAIGADAEANGSQTAAIGGDSHATSPNATAVGAGSKASGGSSTALGAGSKALANDTTAIGVRANASSDSAVAIGNDASAAGSQGLAMGMGAHADVAASVALGYKAVSSNVNSVALGANSTTDLDNVVSVGSKGQERQITNVKAGTATTDAVNVSQLKGVTDALGGGAGLDADGKVIAPSYVVGGTSYNNVGGALTDIDGRVKTNTSDIDGLKDQVNASGVGLVQQDTDSRAITVAKGTDGTLVDFTNKDGSARTLSGVAAGKTGTDAANIAQLTDVASALGGGAGVDANGKVTKPTYTMSAGKDDATGPVDATDVGTALDNLDNRTAGNTKQINQNTGDIANVISGKAGLVQQAGADAAITVGKDTGGTSVNFKGTDGERILTGVAAGAVTATSKDAINGSQLHAASTAVASALGGGAAVSADGSFTPPSYVVGGSKFNNVGGALTDIDDRVTTNTGDIDGLKKQVNVGGVGLVQQDTDTRTITVAKGTDGALVDFSNNAGVERKLTGVAAGTGDKDAVNLGQLKTAGLLDNDGNSNAVTYDVGSNKGSMTLAGSNGTQIKNVADGTDAHDAVNVGQLQKAGIVNDQGETLNAVTYTDASKSQVSFGGAGAANPVLLSNVAAGRDVNDAVNVGQLRGVTSALGGGANVDGQGNVIAPTYTVNNVSYGSVNDALQGLATNLDTVQKSNVGVIQKVQTSVTTNNAFASSGDQSKPATATGNNAVAMGANASASADNSVAIGTNSVADRANTVSVGSAGNERAIANVADAVADADAVNKRQLDAVQSSGQAYTDARVDQVQQQISDVSKSAYSGVAAATALTMIPGVDSDKKFAMGMGVGTFKGQSAVAIGASARLNQRLTIKAGVGTSASGTTVGAGAAWQW